MSFMNKIFLMGLVVLLLTACEDKEKQPASENKINQAEEKSEPKEEKHKYSEDFDIEVEKSPVDYNKNGNDDYKDFLIGAKKDAQNHPRYDSSYINGGYPDENSGVCTDVIWRAFREAGYSLKDMVDTDIKNNMKDYPRVSSPDPNIDFRRVKNLHVFFKKYAVSLSTDINDIEQWMPGDIVFFRGDWHIGIISDYRNEKGVAFVIHNMGQSEREEDFLSLFDLLGKNEPSGHYRFDASKVEEILLPWAD